MKTKGVKQATINALDLLKEKHPVNNCCGVYSFIENLTGRRYIGSSKYLYRRGRNHIKEAVCGDAQHFHKELKRIGVENFKFEVIEFCKLKVLLKREKFHIKKFNSVHPNGFNIQKDPLNHFDFVWTDEMRKRHGDINRGKKLSERHKRKIGLGCKGIPCSEKAKKLISKANKGKKRSPEQVKKMTEARRRYFENGGTVSKKTRRKLSLRLMGNKRLLGCRHWIGRHHTDDAKAKISAFHKGKVIPFSVRKKISKTLKGRIFSKSHREKLSKAFLGKKHSEESKAKMSAIRKGRFFRNGKWRKAGYLKLKK